MNKEELLHNLFYINELDAYNVCSELLDTINEKEYETILKNILSSPIDKALCKLEKEFIIRNGEGNNYMLYFKFKKSIINKILFFLNGKDIYHEQLMNCKENNYYGVYVSDVCEDIKEYRLSHIIEHIEEYSNDNYDFLF